METAMMFLGAVIWLVVPLCLVLSIFRRTRPVAATGLWGSSYILGIWLWITSCIVALSFANVVWMVVGILAMGVGVFAVAIIAAAWAGHWTLVGMLVLGLVIVKGMRVLSYYLAEHSGPKDDNLPLPPSPPLFN